MEQIKVQSDDVDFAIKDFESSGIINKKQAKVLKASILQIINHPELNHYVY